MATITMQADPGETVKLYYAAKVQPWVNSGETAPGAPVDTQVASASGVATFTVTSRIEYMAQRANGRFVKVMDSTTRGAS